MAESRKRSFGALRLGPWDAMLDRMVGATAPTRDYGAGCDVLSNSQLVGLLDTAEPVVGWSEDAASDVGAGYEAVETMVVTNAQLFDLLDPAEPVAGGTRAVAASLLSLAPPTVNYPGQPRDNLGRFGSGTYGTKHKDVAHGLVAKFKGGGKLDRAETRQLVDSLQGMTHRELKELKAKHGIRAAGAKSELVGKIAERLRMKYEGQKGKTKGKGGRDGQATPTPADGPGGGAGGTAAPGAARSSG